MIQSTYITKITNLTKNKMQLENLTSNETEKIIIGHLLRFGNKPIVVSKISDIKNDFFFNPELQKVFISIKSIIQEGGTISAPIIREKTKIKSELLMDCMDTYCNNFEKNIDMLKRYADRRWLVQRSHRVNNEVENSDIAKLMTTLSTDIVSRIRQLEKENVDIQSLMGEFFETQTRNAEAVEKGGLIGIPFGYKYLDDVISGIRAPHYILIKADTSVGKSAFALNILSNVLNENKRVVLFSLEMSKFQNIARILGIRTKIQPLNIETGMWINEKAELEAKDKLYKQDLTIYENKRYIDEIITAIYAEHADKPIDLVVIDYLQNILVDDTRYESYTISSQKIQSIGKELNIPILVASQINKDGNARGSGDIDNHSDFAIKLEKGDMVGELDMTVVKNRHGMLNFGKMKFDGGGGIYELS